MEELIGALATAASLYLLFDFFFWNGGLVNPSILERMSEMMLLVPF